MEAVAVSCDYATHDYVKFQPGDKVLVLLPTSTNKLLAEWRGPYPTVQRISNVNYEVKMTDSRRKNRILHVNMLQEWHSHSAACQSVSRCIDSRTYIVI